jgi:hypothetical protein
MTFVSILLDNQLGEAEGETFAPTYAARVLQKILKSLDDRACWIGARR